MNAITTTSTPQIKMINGKLSTTSRNIAQVFGKNHKHVIRDIESLDIPQDFAKSNFGLCSYKGKNNQSYKMHNVSRDGFTLLAMGFTGKKAMSFKLGYIAAFNQMEAELLQPSQGGLISADQLSALRKAVADVVKRDYLPCQRSHGFNRVYANLWQHFTITSTDLLLAAHYDAALMLIAGEPAKALPATVLADTALADPDMVMVRRENLTALINRAQLASERYTQVLEVQRLLDDAQIAMREFVHLTYDPVREVGAVAANVWSELQSKDPQK